MKNKIKKILLGYACPGGSYDLDGAVEELANLQAKTIIKVFETLRLWRPIFYKTKVEKEDLKELFRLKKELLNDKQK